MAKSAGRIVTGLGLVPVFAAWAILAHAADRFPSRTITFIVPYTAGGTSDLLARIVGEHYKKVWGQGYVIDNRGGAGGQIAMEAVARSAPDGHTLALTASGTMGINPYVYAKLRYDPMRDFAPVTVMVDLPLILAVHPSVPARSVRDLIALARARPGQLTVGSAGIGTHQHLAQALFASIAGVNIAHVPYKGAAAAGIDLLGGHIDAMFDNIGGQVQNVRAGKTRALGVSSRERAAALAEVPTIAEAGVPGYDTVPWFGLAVPKATPAEVVARLQVEAGAALDAPDVRQRLADLGMLVVASSPEQATARVKENLETFGRIAKEIRLKPE